MFHFRASCPSGRLPRPRGSRPPTTMLCGQAWIFPRLARGLLEPPIWAHSRVHGLLLKRSAALSDALHTHPQFHQDVEDRPVEPAQVCLRQGGQVTWTVRHPLGCRLRGAPARRRASHCFGAKSTLGGWAESPRFSDIRWWPPRIRTVDLRFDHIGLASGPGSRWRRRRHDGCTGPGTGRCPAWAHGSAENPHRPPQHGNRCLSRPRLRACLRRG